jgi:Ser/Thr protein kinase RdoA (MazF antagonist)
MRTARLIVCDAEGGPLATTREFDVPSPYWSHVEPVVAAASAELGLSIRVLRLLEVERGVDGTPDRTTYLVEPTEPSVALESATAEQRQQPALLPEPHRMPWAEPGGSAALIAWAEDALLDRGIRPSAPPVQVRTWNLSSIWRMPTTAGTAWLKAVPPFFAHEGAVIERFAGFGVPRLLARADGVSLLADIAGEDLYDPDDEQALTMIDLLLDIQRGPGEDVDALLALGLPDWRVPALQAPFAHTLDVRADELKAHERRAIDALIDGLDARHSELVACGIPDALVHGDFHPGNMRGTGVDITILDWGDSGVGHPLLDLPAFTQWMPPSQRTKAEAHWVQRWKNAVPGSDPHRAAAILEPIAALRLPVIYRHFLDHIEPDERVYHETDDLVWLRRTAAILAS